MPHDRGGRYLSSSVEEPQLGSVESGNGGSVLTLDAIIMSMLGSPLALRMQAGFVYAQDFLQPG